MHSENQELPHDTDMVQMNKTSCDKEQLYGDTRRSHEYTTENFKMEIANIPGRVNFQVVKKLLERRFKVTPHKIRLGSNRAFIAFKTEEERDEAIAKVNNQDFRGKTLVAKISTPRDDLVAQNRKSTVLDSELLSPVGEEAEHESQSTEIDINARVCPLWSMVYEEQLKLKSDLMRSVLSIGKQLCKLVPSLKNDSPELHKWAKEHSEICCAFEDVVPSPVLTNYRNKCEFNISADGKIGFKIGRYKDGADRVCRPPDNCPILTRTMFDIIDLFANYLSESTSLKGFDLVTHEGHYRQLTIRCNSDGEYLVIVDLHPQDLSHNELDIEMSKVITAFEKLSSVVSIYFNISKKAAFSSSNHDLKLVHGKSCLYETLYIDPEKPLKFRIGPSSFFQVNTKAAELLYKAIIDVAQLKPTSMVLDVGCGTGTIGLSLARKVNHVIGIEIVPAAVEDARSNASENEIENVTFFAGKAEELIGESIRILKKKLEYQNIDDGEIVAIVDPPRVGFNNSFVKTLRASNIKKIVYIACDPKANTNLLTLCRPKSKGYQGEPFVPTRAKAFDLFPHTKCCELMIVYERLSIVNGKNAS